MKRTGEQILSFLEMLSGTILMAAAFGAIILPMGFAAGGVTGFCRVIGAFLPVPLSALVLLADAALLLAGWIFVGRGFAVKTVSVSLLFPLLLELASRFPMRPDADPAVSVVMAGVLLGAGAGLVLRSGASSGGFDVAAVVLNRKWGLPVAAVMNVIDGAVILIQAVGQPLPGTLCGLAVITISAAVVGKLSASPEKRSPAFPSNRQLAASN